MKGVNPTTARAMLRRWEDPVRFASEVLGLTSWDRQAELLRSLTSGRKLIACRSGHKIGKSTIGAAAGLWWLVTKPRARVILTAPSAHQIQNIVYAEVRRLYGDAEARGVPLGGECHGTAYTGVRMPGARDLFGVSTDTPERMAGLSSPNLLFIVDEASGIDERIWEVILGNAAGGATILALSNPTRTSGTYFDAFHTKRDAWLTFHVPSTSTPNFRGDPAQRIPGLATPEWVELAKTLWGEHSPYFDVRVRGEFPTEGENVVIGLSTVEEARARGRALAALPDPPDPLRLGLDVARYGDDETVITLRRGLRMYPQEVLRMLDGPTIAGHVMRLVRERARLGEVARLRGDVIGYGASAIDALRPHSEFLSVESVNVAERASDPAVYPNQRSELWFRLRDWLRGGGALPDDDKLAAELVAPHYAVDPKGRLVVNSKDIIKETLGRSPDRADSAALCVSQGLAPAYGSAALDALRKLLPRRRY